MRKRWFPYLLFVTLGLLLPAAALAANPNPNLSNRIRTISNQSNRNYRNGAWGARTASPANHGGFGTLGTRTPSPANHGGFGTLAARTSSRANHGGFGTLPTRTPSPGNNGGLGYPNNNGYYGNPTYGQGGYWRDRDGDGDRDYWRRRHHRHHRRHDDDDDDGGWRSNGRWNGDTPPGWHHGRKVGWGGSDVPPGQAKKRGWD